MSLSDFARVELTRLAARPTLDDLFARSVERGGERMTFADARAAVVADRPEQ